MIHSGRIRPEWINFQGQEATPLGHVHQLWNGNPWYSFKAPATAWPEDKPVGLDFTLYSAAGIATAPVSFKPESGEVHYEILNASISNQTDASRPSTLCGEVGGTRDYDGTFHPTEFSPDDKLVVEDDGWVEGQVEGVVDAMWHNDTVFGCKLSPNKQPCSEQMPNSAPQPDGLDAVSVSFSKADDPSEVELWWSFHDPEVGYVDAGDDECNSHVWGHFDDPVNVQTVPMSTLQKSGPIDLTLAGSGHIDKHGGREPASIDYRWEYKITIQKVDAEGNPL